MPDTAHDALRLTPELPRTLTPADARGLDEDDDTVLLRRDGTQIDTWR
ncbi:hypothetical protein [Rathayibacter rathayi]|nr:hypothetical protein [Rathayibacter rathayi]MWV73316.1 hypothetical protein [Rathayibacter rathayi NCPPB 2980 = VKM Ac-1601]TWD69641.1 hypothetical protein FB469_1390 [Rathayibacter rathayi]SOE02666.1 hypothetical protein SAMN06295924_101507 [Rathayibacter rathayi NCPPB 2980 = VKM Ac-1601]